jgi:hypothetical protein
MVGLLLKNDLIELTLGNADSGTAIKGTPYFDAEDFAQKKGESTVGRLLGEEDLSMDPAARQLHNLVEKLKSMPQRRRL